MTTLYIICFDPDPDRMTATANAAIPPEVTLNHVFHDNHGKAWVAAFLLMAGLPHRDQAIKLMSLGDEDAFCLEPDHQTNAREAQKALQLAIVTLAEKSQAPIHALLVTHAPHPGLQAIEEGLALTVLPGDAVTHYVSVVDGTLMHMIHHTPCPVPMPG